MHSTKDVPTELIPDTELCTMLPREAIPKILRGFSVMSWCWGQFAATKQPVGHPQRLVKSKGIRTPKMAEAFSLRIYNKLPWQWKLPMFDRKMHLPSGSIFQPAIFAGEGHVMVVYLLVSR